MNYYQVLNIKETASKDEIKKAYNKLALTSHPDKNKSSDAAERFRSVNEAYKVLKDDNKRELYDRFELPKLKHTDPRSHNKYNQQRRRDRHDDTFFTGSSEIFSQEQRYQSELDRIRKINSDQLDAVNAQRRKSNLRNNRSGVPNTSKKSMGGRFVGDILADTNDDDYEKLVLERLRAMVGRS